MVLALLLLSTLSVSFLFLLVFLVALFVLAWLL